MKNKFFIWKNNTLRTINQKKLPLKEEWIELRTIKDYFSAIKELKVRGAPAIGVCAGFGILSSISKINNIQIMKKTIIRNCNYLRTSRPTAVNLFYVLNKIENITLNYNGNSCIELKNKIKKFVVSHYKYEVQTCEKMANYGVKLIKNNMNILTHCNTGMLATPGIGTALGIIYKAKEKKKNIHVYVPETRPLLQGGRLTIYEFEKANILYTLITDNMRGLLFKENKIDIVFVGADRIALNGDTANKIGTYESAVLAYYHKIPFYIVAPISTFDKNAKTGKNIIIEKRDPKEVKQILNKKISIAKNVFNPAFDITPAKLITGIITEKGIIKAKRECIKKLF